MTRIKDMPVVTVPAGFEPWRNEYTIRRANVRAIVMLVAFVAVACSCCTFTGLSLASSLASNPTDLGVPVLPGGAETTAEPTPEATAEPESTSTPTESAILQQRALPTSTPTETPTLTPTVTLIPTNTITPTATFTIHPWSLTVTAYRLTETHAAPPPAAATVQSRPIVREQPVQRAPRVITSPPEIIHIEPIQPTPQPTYTFYPTFTPPATSTPAPNVGKIRTIEKSTEAPPERGYNTQP